MLSFGQSLCCRGCRNFRVNHFRVTERWYFFLRNENLIADGAMLAFRQTGFRTGRSKGFVNHFRVSSGFYAFGFLFTAYTSFFSYAIFGAGCRLRYNPFAEIMCMCVWLAVFCRRSLSAFRCVVRCCTAGCRITGCSIVGSAVSVARGQQC